MKGADTRTDQRRENPNNNRKGEPTEGVRRPLGTFHTDEKEWRDTGSTEHKNIPVKSKILGK